MVCVFTDYHHGDLYYSLHLLFEKRMGWDLYRPIGLDWFNNGFWKIAEPYGNAADTIGQYLDINNDGWIPFKNLNGKNYVKDNVYYCYDPGHDYYHKAITFEQFKLMEFDLILPTFEAHNGPYDILKCSFQPKAKIVSQLGNTGQKTHLPYVISTVPYTPNPGQKVVFYHQEIDPAQYFYVPPDPNTKNIYSMVNCFPYADIYRTYKAALPEVNMKSYGGGCPDGALFGSNGVSIKMRESNIAWHLKPQGGVGHSTMGWFASGRPIITNMSQHRVWGGDALRLFEPGVTCLDIESHSVKENCKLIRDILLPENNMNWANRVLQRFNEVINYEKESKELVLFFLEITS